MAQQKSTDKKPRVNKPVCKVDVTIRIINEHKRQIQGQKAMQNIKHRTYIQGIRDGPALQRQQYIDDVLHLAREDMINEKYNAALLKIATIELVMNLKQDSIQNRTKAMMLSMIHFNRMEFSAAFTYAVEIEDASNKCSRSLALNRDGLAMIERCSKKIEMNEKEIKQMNNMMVKQQEEKNSEQ
jgi:hypothetical protein